MSWPCPYFNGSLTGAEIDGGKIVAHFAGPFAAVLHVAKAKQA